MRGIRPILQQGNYAGALLAAAQQMGNQIAQVTPDDPSTAALIHRCVIQVDDGHVQALEFRAEAVRLEDQQSVHTVFGQEVVASGDRFVPRVRVLSGVHW